MIVNIAIVIDSNCNKINFDDICFEILFDFLFYSNLFDNIYLLQSNEMHAINTISLTYFTIAHSDSNFNRHNY